MIRYLNSFVLTLFLYVGIAYALFVMFADEKITIRKSEPLKTISLNHIELIKEIVKPKEIIKKKEILKPKEVEPEKIVKKVEPKKLKPKKIVKKIPKKKKVIKKKIVKKKVIKQKKIVKKEIEKKIIKPAEKTVAKPVEKIVKQTTKIEEKKTSAVVKQAKKVDVTKDYLAKHLAQVRIHIMKNAKYSKRAKRLRIQDVVKVKFTLLSNGKVKNIQVLSGNKHLHKSAIKAVEKASISFPKVSKDIDIIIPIEYNLI